MKSFIFSLLALTVCCFGNLTAQKTPDYLEGRIIFKLDTEKCKSVNDSKLRDILHDYGVTTIEQKFPHARVPDKKTNQYGQKLIDLSQVYEVRTDYDIFKTISALEESGLVVYAQPHYIPELFYTPDDPLISQTYHLSKIKAFEAWDIHQGNSNVVIGITDTGTDVDHPDLMYQVAYNENDPIDGIDNDFDGYVDNFRGWDLGCNDNYPQAEANNHGIWVSGLSSAQVNNATGVAGVGFNCRFLPIKISDSNGMLTMAYEGIVYAADHGCNIINCSWGSDRWNPFGQDVIDYAVINKNALVVAACGNSNTLVSFYPASFDRVLSVSATTSLDEKWTPDNTGTTAGSSYGYQVDIAAPGAGLRSTDNDGYMVAYGGTSFAAPVVAGVAALVWSYYPELNALQIAERLKTTTDNIDTIAYNAPYAGLMGSGRVNMLKALSNPVSPALVFEDMVVEDDRENNYQNSNLVLVKGKIINYLTDSPATLVNISCNNEYIELNTTEIMLGTMSSGEVYTLGADNCISFTIDENTPYNSLVILTLTYSSTDYEATQYLEIYVKPGYKDLDANNISISITGNGRYGYEDLNGKKGIGMNYPGFDDLFYDCGLIAGTSAEKVYCSVRQETDFETLQYPAYINPPQFGTMHIASKMNDSHDMFASGIEITQQVYAWDNDPNRNYFIISYDLKNTSATAISNLYAGLFADFDLVQSSHNEARYDAANHYIYTLHTGNQNLYAAFKLLSAHGENHYALEQVAGGDGLVDLTNGFNDSEKFHMLTNSRDEAITGENGSDVVMTLSAGPVSLNPNDSVRIVFACMVSESKYGLDIAAQQAQLMYNTVMNNSAIDENKCGTFRLYPNPASEKLIIESQEFVNIGKAGIRITDTRGNTLILEEVSGVPACIDISNIKNGGIYFVEVLTDTFSSVQKLVITR